MSERENRMKEKYFSSKLKAQMDQNTINAKSTGDAFRNGNNGDQTVKSLNVRKANQRKPPESDYQH